MISILDHNRKDLIQSLKKRWKAQHVPHHRKFTWKSQWKFLFFSQLLTLLSPTAVPPASVRLLTGGHSVSLGTAVTKSPSRRCFWGSSFCFTGSIFTTVERKWLWWTRFFLQRFLKGFWSPHRGGGLTAFSGWAILLAEGLQHPSYSLLNCFCCVTWLPGDGGFLFNHKSKELVEDSCKTRRSDSAVNQQ